MEYLHIMHNDKFNTSYIEFLEKNFDISQHIFIFVGGYSEEEIPILKRENILKLEDNLLKHKNIFLLFKELNRYFKTSKKVFLHGLFGKKMMMFLFLNKKYLKKCNWIVWGGDLYYHNLRKKTLKSDIYEFIRGRVIKNLNEISTLVPGDYQLAKKWYNIKGKYKKAIYINPIKKEYLDDISRDDTSNIKKETINIQIGNSADITNNHIEILDSLEKFKNENIKIFAPLSYGDKKNSEKVSEYGRKKFGDKFIPMTAFLKPEEYTKYQKNIDILIFNHKRQQGLGNIFSLAYLGKKIYLRKDITSWDYLKNYLDLDLFDINCIKNENFNKFISGDCRGNKEKMSKTVYSEKYIAKIWAQQFIN